MDMPFEFAGGVLCLDFANSLNALFKKDYEGERESDPFARMLRWFEERGDPPLPIKELGGLARRDPAGARAVARRGEALSAALREIFGSVREGARPPGEALAVLQREISRSAKHAELLPGSKGGPWTWRDPQGRLDAVLGPVARSAADLLLSGRAEEIKLCAADSCRWMFLDESRNQGRKWCDMKVCGNRSKVRRYRSRHC